MIQYFFILSWIILTAQGEFQKIMKEDNSENYITRHLTTEVKEFHNKLTPTSGLSFNKCLSSYNTRRYLDSVEILKRHSPIPPVLFTFPGSGNTWCRLLLGIAKVVFLMKTIF